LNACDELFVHISLLFSALLVYGCVPEIMPLSTLYLSQKVSMQTSLNLLVIVILLLSLIFGKIFDLVLLFRYSEGLMSCHAILMWLTMKYDY